MRFEDKIILADNQDSAGQGRGILGYTAIKTLKTQLFNKKN
jgi:hypothetical protein